MTKNAISPRKFAGFGNAGSAHPLELFFFSFFFWFFCLTITASERLAFRNARPDLPRFASTGRASGGLGPKGFYHQREERKGKRRKRARRARGKKKEKKRTSNQRKRRNEDEKHALNTAKTSTRQETRDKEGIGKRKERRPREKKFLNALVWRAGARKSQN